MNHQSPYWNHREKWELIPELGWATHHVLASFETGEVSHRAFRYDPAYRKVVDGSARVYSTFPAVRVYHRPPSDLFNWTVALMFLAGAVAMIFLTARY